MNKKQYLIVNNLPEYEIKVKVPFFPAGTLPKEYLAKGLDGIRMMIEKSAFAISLLWMSVKACETEEQYEKLRKKYREFEEYLNEVIKFCKVFSEQGIKESWSKFSPEEKVEAKQTIENLLEANLSPEARKRLEKLLEESESDG